MKYAILVGDGMADYPVEELGGKTPLQVARTPHMDWLARHGELGLVKTIPEGFTPGSEIANLSILGYDPVRYYKGRGPLEAASLGLDLEPDDLAFRCNLVTLQGRGQDAVMEDFSAGHITDAEARELIDELNRELSTAEIRFHCGVSYRHVLVWAKAVQTFPAMETLELKPPHDIIGKRVSPYLEKTFHEKAAMDRLVSLMIDSQTLLERHPVNVARGKRGLSPANSIWLWGQGRFPQMITLKERFGIEGAMISAVHLLKGIGILAGLRALEVPGATGYFDTNYEGKAAYALSSLEEGDFVFVHVEAPDEAGHMGDARLKVEAIETFDQKIVGPILEGMASKGRFRLLLLPDHCTPISVRTHTADPVPYVLYSSDDHSGSTKWEGFSETEGQRSGIYLEKGDELIERLFGSPNVVG